MAFSSCICYFNSSFKIDCSGQTIRSLPSIGKDNKLSFSLKNSYSELFGQRVTRVGADFQSHWSFLRGSRITLIPKRSTFVVRQNASGAYASWLTNSQIASSVFTAGTVTVLPFYALMVLVPKEKLVWFLEFQTKMVMESYVPYIVLGALYGFMLHLHWKPDTFLVLYGTKYTIPELPGAATLFTTDVQVATAWVHILCVDLFAARQVFHDGLENEIQTRHSIFLCLFFCPFGIISHVITKALTERVRRIKHGM